MSDTPVNNTTPSWVQIVSNWFKANIDINQGWLPFINTIGKWAVAFIIKTATLFFCFFLLVLLIKFTSIIKDVRQLVLKDALDIIPKGSEVISSPDINYNKDLNSIDDAIKFMKDNKKQNEKKETESTSKKKTDEIKTKEGSKK